MVSWKPTWKKTTKITRSKVFEQRSTYFRDVVYQDMSVKIGIDNGKGHLKMTLTLYDPDNQIRTKTGRVKMTDGIGQKGKFNFSIV